MESTIAVIVQMKKTVRRGQRPHLAVAGISFNVELPKSAYKKSNVCDGHNDCGENDRSDEENCPLRTTTPPSCGSEQFQCTISGTCLPIGWVCNQNNDCGGNDRSDEENCPWSTTTPPICGSEQFQCTISGKCLPKTYLCDGENHCGGNDKSDEDNCSETFPPSGSVALGGILGIISMNVVIISLLLLW
jgi:hypothetical protein